MINIILQNTSHSSYFYYLRRYVYISHHCACYKYFYYFHFFTSPGGVHGGGKTQPTPSSQRCVALSGCFFPSGPALSLDSLKPDSRLSLPALDVESVSKILMCSSSESPPRPFLELSTLLCFNASPSLPCKNCLSERSISSLVCISLVAFGKNVKPETASKLSSGTAKFDNGVFGSMYAFGNTNAATFADLGGAL